MIKRILGAAAALAFLATSAFAGTPTTNYSWIKPAIGADSSQWGNFLNSDLDGIDSTVFSVSGVANAACPKAGCTYTGSVTIPTLTITGATALQGSVTTGTNSSAAATTVNGPAGALRTLFFDTAGVSRWVVLGADSAAESGSNVGSDFRINRFNDAGSSIDTPFLITRSTGLITLSDGLTVNGAATFNNGITGNLTGAVAGNASTATALQTGREINMTGDVAWGVAFDGTSNVTATGTVVSASTSTAGKVALATGAQVVTGTDTTHAVTPASLTSAQSIGADGCTTLPGGLIEQWGYSAGPFSNNSSGIVDFVSSTCPFTTAVYNVMFTADVTGNTPSNSPYAVATTSSPSTTSVGFVVEGFQSGGGGHLAGFWWFAIGK